MSLTDKGVVSYLCPYLVANDSLLCLFSFKFLDNFDGLMVDITSSVYKGWIQYMVKTTHYSYVAISISS